MEPSIRPLVKSTLITVRVARAFSDNRFRGDWPNVFLRPFHILSSSLFTRISYNARYGNSRRTGAQPSARLPRTRAHVPITIIRNSRNVTYISPTLSFRDCFVNRMCRAADRLPPHVFSYYFAKTMRVPTIYFRAVEYRHVYNRAFRRRRSFQRPSDGFRLTVRGAPVVSTIGKIGTIRTKRPVGRAGRPTAAAPNLGPCAPFGRRVPHFDRTAGRFPVDITTLSDNETRSP